MIYLTHSLTQDFYDEDCLVSVGDRVNSTRRIANFQLRPNGQPGNPEAGKRTACIWKDPFHCNVHSGALPESFALSRFFMLAKVYAQLTYWDRICTDLREHTGTIGNRWFCAKTLRPPRNLNPGSWRLPGKARCRISLVTRIDTQKRRCYTTCDNTSGAAVKRPTFF